MKAYILLLIALFSFSCSPQKRLARLVNNHPELLQTDTLHDSVLVPAVKVDTSFVLLPGKPVTIVKDSIVYEFLIDENNNLKFEANKPAKVFPVVVLKKSFTAAKKQTEKSKNYKFVIGLIFGLVISRLIFNLAKK